MREGEDVYSDRVVLRTLTVRIPAKHYEVLVRAMRENDYTSIAELVRSIIRDWVRSYESRDRGNKDKDW